MTLNRLRIPQAEDAKYLRLHLDRRLNWRKDIFFERKQFELQVGKMYWLLDRKLRLSVEKKLLSYNSSNLFGPMASNRGAHFAIKI